MRPGDSDTLAQWLSDHGQDADAVIASVDMLCYGGLIASRTPVVPQELAQQRLHNLRILKALYPHLSIYASSVIMRLSITTDSPEKLAYWQDVALYSQLADRVERLKEKRWAEELETVKERIPPALLEEYLRSRHRNHLINLETVALAADGVLDAAILCQEDAAPKGLHIPEQQALTERAKKFSVTDRVFLHAGADEASLTLLTRAVCDFHECQPKVHVHYGSPSGAQRIALYEDRSIAENVTRHIRAAGGSVAKYSKQADMTLFVHTPKGPQREAMWQGVSREHRAPGTPARILREIIRAVELEQNAAVADVAFCNGGDVALVDALLKAGIFPKLAAYAGWNTAGNTIGTALTHGILVTLAQQLALHGKKASQRAVQQVMSHHISFLFERIIDDCIYQSRIRREANSYAENLGVSPLALGDIRPKVTRFIKKRLEPVAQEVFQRYYADKKTALGFCIDPKLDIKIKLPWPRTFEVEVDAKIKMSR